jgi:predicted nucleic acid-binding protein
MTAVVADTSPLNYLLLIGEIAVMPSLYGQVFIPPEVLAELSDADLGPHSRAASVRCWNCRASPP